MNPPPAQSLGPDPPPLTAPPRFPELSSSSLSGWAGFLSSVGSIYKLRAGQLADVKRDAGGGHYGCSVTMAGQASSLLARRGECRHRQDSLFAEFPGFAVLAAPRPTPAGVLGSESCPSRWLRLAAGTAPPLPPTQRS